MKVPLSLGIVISLVGRNVEAKALGREAIGSIHFICDQLGPEDLAVVPGSEWVLSSGMVANGAIRLINLRDKSTTVLFPSAFRSFSHRPRGRTPIHVVAPFATWAAQDPIPFGRLPVDRDDVTHIDEGHECSDIRRNRCR